MSSPVRPGGGWVPNQGHLQQALEVLRASQSPNNEIQRKVQQTLLAYQANPEFNRYLLFVLVNLPREQESTRAVAGIVLKNNIKSMFEELKKAAPAILADIKTQCMIRLGDPSQLIRATVGLIVTMIVQQGGLEDWPVLLPGLLQLTRSPDPHAVNGAFWTMHKICEDSHREMCLMPGVIETLLPHFVQFFGHSDSKIRSFSLSCINQFILDRPAALVDALPKLLPMIFKIAVDPDADVRKNVCQAIVLFLEVSFDHMKPQLPQIVEYMLQCSKDEDDQVALEACEFWLQITEEEDAIPVLAPYLPQLVPLLLMKMRYSELEVLMLKGDEDDATVADSAQDVKPHIARSRMAGEGGAADEEEEEDDEEPEDWTLRKCAAAGLDVMSTVYGDMYPEDLKGPSGDILALLLPHLHTILQSTDWGVRESGILALGAIAEGCTEGMLPHLPTIIPFLIKALADPKPLVRSITCWTLSRYVSWIADTGREKGLLHHFTDGLLRRILDNNKKVQEAACSALAVLEEEAKPEHLAPYLGFILQHINQAFGKYQKGNLLILYDAVGTLAESVKEQLQRKEYVEILMPPLMAKWAAIPDDDRDLLPLLECLQNVAIALKESFLPYCEEIHTRCARILMSNQRLAQLAAEEPDKYEEPDPDFLIVPLDLLSALAEAVGGVVESLVSRFGIIEILARCGKDPVPEVRQSAFALLGDYAQVCFPHVQPHYGQFVHLLSRHLDPKFTSVCNNAAWAIGEIAVKCAERGLDMEPLVQYVLPPLINILKKQDENNSMKMITLMENTGITLGRIAAVCPRGIGQFLQHFIKPWCLAMRNIRANEEKHQAFRGICLAIKTNYGGLVPSLIFFCDAVISWDPTPPDLQREFNQILQTLKASANQSQAGKWEEYLATFPAQLQQPLRERYKV